MKEIRILFFVAAFLMIVLAMQIEADWLLFYVAGLYVGEGILERIQGTKKKAKAIFFIEDKHKTILNYLLIVGVLTVNYIFFSKQDSIYFIFCIALIVWVILSGTGKAYFLFDEQGIKTVRRTLEYSQIHALHFTEQGLQIETNDRSEEMRIPRKLLNAELIEFLQSRTNVKSLG